MCYFDNATRRTKITVDNICHELKNPKLGEVDLVVGTGFSGILLLSAIHLQSGLSFGAIRKGTGKTHSGQTVETGGMRYLPREVQRYVIIDDFTASGKTLSNIQVAMAGHECVGIILYQETKFNRGDTLKDYPNIPLICLANDIEEIEVCIPLMEKEACRV